MRIIYLHSVNPVKLLCADVENFSSHSLSSQNETGQTEDIVVYENLDDLNSAQTQAPSLQNFMQDVLVIIPGQDVLLTQAKLPKLSSNRLAQALPFALEEQLTEEVDQLHFAIGEYQSEGYYPVAIINKNKLQQYISALDSLAINKNQMIPATLALPIWHIFIGKENCIARTAPFSGFACEPENLSTYLELSLQEATANAANLPPTVIHFFVNKNKENLLPAAVNLQPQIAIEKHPNNKQIFFKEMVKALNELPTINLLQGAYKPEQKISTTKKLWLYTAYVVIAMIGLSLFSQLISYFALHHQLAKMENQIASIYHRQFPESKAVIAPKERMQDKLSKLSAAMSGQSFLALLAYLGPSLHTNQSIVFQNFDYRDKILNIELSANSFENLEAFIHTLKSSGLNVKQQSAESSGEKILAHLQVSGVH